MDSIARHNKDCWEGLSEAGIDYSKPILDLTEDSAWSLINRDRISLEVCGKDVLCLAASGGQQSAAFGVLGANVTVFDICESMLRKDVETAEHYGFRIRVEQGDMRDLGVFEDESFDIVWLAYAINFVPDAAPVIGEASRVLRPKGHFKMSFSNPYFMGVYEKYNRAYQEGRLRWKGYAVTEPYTEGAEIKVPEPFIEVWPSDDEEVKVRVPKTFRHTFGTMLNLLVQNNIRLLGLWEHHTDYYFDELDPDPDPGSWDHFDNLIPGYISIWAKKE